MRIIKVGAKDDAVENFVGKIEELLGEMVLDKPLKYNEMRFTVDETDDSLGKKIRRATEMKIPVILIVGPKDVEANEVSVRLKDKEEKVKLEKLTEYLKNL